MAKKPQPKKGDLFGAWKLEEPIGQGGNSDVWRVSRHGRKDAALKILREIDKVTYARFTVEIEVISRNTDIEGIIPLIDRYLPSERIDGPPWYVMPLAKPISSLLFSMKPDEIVREFIKLAETLAELHERGIAHRDIKPQNILVLNDRLCFSDFGLVKYPGRLEITPPKRDVGAKFTMAPEMRRLASSAKGPPADVFSFVKTLWIALTKVELGFDGQYASGSNLALQNHHRGLWTTKLDELFTECTSDDPLSRPTITRARLQLEEWLKIVNDFKKRNLTEWTELMQSLFPLGAPKRVTWTDVDAICVVLNRIGKVTALNHMFFPSRGGNTVKEVRHAGEDGFIELHASGVSILKPRKLTFESFGSSPDWNYFRLEAEEMQPAGIEDASRGGLVEFLTELSPGCYDAPSIWYNSRDGYDEDEVPETARLISRCLKGSFVIFSTRSPYNMNTATYDGRHQQMSEEEFRVYIERAALRDKEISEDMLGEDRDPRSRFTRDRMAT